MPALAILCGLVACAFAAPAQASSTARFGIHDDAWLIFGPGTLEERIDWLDRLGVELRALHRPLGPGRARAA